LGHRPVADLSGRRPRSGYAGISTHAKFQIAEPDIVQFAIGANMGDRSWVILSDGQSREEMIKLGLQRDVALGLQVE
jgi:hypothetical protein